MNHARVGRSKPRWFALSAASRCGWARDIGASADEVRARAARFRIAAAMLTDPFVIGCLLELADDYEMEAENIAPASIAERGEA